MRHSAPAFARKRASSALACVVKREQAPAMHAFISAALAFLSKLWNLPTDERLPHAHAIVGAGTRRCGRHARA